MSRFQGIVIAVDFDGTCVSHAYPDVGFDCPHAVRVLNRLSSEGARLLLWTMRSGRELDAARAWFDYNGIPLWAVNTNPGQSGWTTSPKAHANLYIDDAAFGCPLVRPEGVRPYVDWLAVERVMFPHVMRRRLIRSHGPFNKAGKGCHG